MMDPFEPAPSDRAVPRDAGLVWTDIFTYESPANLLATLAASFGPGLHALEFREAGAALARWESTFAPSVGSHREEVMVGAAPPATLTVEWNVEPRSADRRRLHDAATAVGAWREVRRERDRVERRFTQRTCELDLIQALGRRAAEARTPRELFRSAVETLESGEPLDAAAVVHSLEGERTTWIFLSRPLEDSVAAALARAAAGPLGGAPSAHPEQIALSAFDEQAGPRAAFSESDLVLLPVQRRGRTLASLAILPSQTPREDQLRVQFSAVNQLSLHLDRILTVREAEAGRFRSMLDSIPQAVVLTDPQLQVLHANRSAHRIAPTVGVALEGSWEDTVRRLGLEDALDALREGGGPVRKDDVHPDRHHAFTVDVALLAGDDGPLQGWVFVLTDVTESRRLHQQLSQSEKMSSLGQMISGVAHELNNPLTSILGYTQLLGLACDDPAQRERMETLEREAQRCRKIVQNLLSFARRRDPERKRLSLNDVIRSVEGLMGYQLRVDDVELATELHKDLPPIHADEHQLQQILVNLITNAQQSIGRGSESGRIVVRTATRSDGGVALEVVDNGPGIPDDLRGRIFDPFFTTKADGQGTGLGLSLVYGIVTSHGGTIEAVSIDEGAMFRVILPAGDPVGRRPGGDTVAAAPAARCGRVLVIDDEPALEGMVREALQLDGHEVQVETEGASALARLDREVFDLILADLRMPGIGAEAIHGALLERGSPQAERMVLTTGDTLGQAAESIAQRAGLELLQKPFDLERLCAVVRRRLGD